VSGVLAGVEDLEVLAHEDLERLAGGDRHDRVGLGRTAGGAEEEGARNATIVAAPTRRCARGVLSMRLSVDEAAKTAGRIP